MSQEHSIEILNRLLAIYCRSFPMYLTHARPWTHVGDQRAIEAVELVVADQRAIAERISQLILEGGGLPDPGKFPLLFTDVHDLSLDYLIREAIQYQKADIVAIQQCVEAFNYVLAMKPLAEEALGLAKGHLESLEELIATKAVSK